MKLQLIKEEIRTLIFEENEEEYYKIPAKEFEELMKLSGYHGKGLSKIKKFEGKPIWIEGDLDLSDTPTDSLGNVKYINGRLDIRNTKISDLSGVVIKGYTWDGGTPIERRREAAILNQKREEANERRDSNEWSIENGDDESLCANALYQSLINSGEIEEITEEEEEELNLKIDQLNDLKEKYDESEDHDDELYDRISELETEIEELKDKQVTIYNLSPTKYKYYGLRTFEIIDVPGLRGNEYAVGDEYDFDKALLEYASNYIDEVGLDGFRENFLNDYLDVDAIRSYFEDFYDDDVRENPDVYFTIDDFALSDEQEERIEELQEYIKKIESLKSKLEEKQENLEDEIEDPEEYSKQYDIIQTKIDTCETQIENTQEEIDSIEPDTDDPTPAMVEEKVSEMVEDKMYDPASSLKEWGMDVKEYIDTDDLAKGLANSEGYGMMASYDGTYDTEYVNNESYYIIRTN